MVHAERMTGGCQGKVEMSYSRQSRNVVLGQVTLGRRVRRTKAKAAKPDAKAAKPEGARDGSKTARILDLLNRPDGVTAKELMKATGWMPHSVRGFLSDTVGKKMGLTVTSTKGEDGERTYSVKA